MDMCSLHCSKLNDRAANELSCFNKARQEDKNEANIRYNKECNYKLFFFIVQLQQKLKEVEKENEKLKALLKKYNKETIDQDNEVIKRALLLVSCLIFIVIFFLF
ncbi:conserved Plasmodium protein, unknown function [Plasmodium vivax]|uniref:Uncharacterized protein n=6 Tax=Plasmodium vivax TaxID=5855 RepID=A5K855_PLAVS|nr:hypothetical protein, conserved [Plasmodium vivax]KMZ79252.1 hypothetical protein PVIIG_01726 [Plasmodium vivax India VII]KMZ85396.1 hypothetical protein PVBG_02082 [Plasmodium vivax Brazil I]KMZ91273.1 hypothetical protein PVMG_00147 [Plasmodium vivax Mauritania I]KMZ98312.1 hypothetical protein PVNG_03453 [Plasmodium vivax North Korean]EDL44469.1 hypothetical protein, conserved [Plasmodium vivax]|eukprot:XP_001614196.1 hypothetical protein [Plasmodium vivax Sal-1]